MKALSLFIAGLACTFLQAQKLTISGYVKDDVTREVLIGASIVEANARTGTATNQYGFFSLTIAATDTIELLVSFQGYRIQAKKITAKTNLRLDVFLQSSEGVLGEVIISTGRNNRNVQSPQMSVIDVPLSAIKNLPVLLGERDVMKIIQLLPGVQAAQEGTTGFFVRGGNADQNLVQLDEGTVYNPSHLFGLFSTFNVNAINSVQLIKGGFPAEYGGRLSSILSITMKEGNKQTFQAEGGVGILSNNLTVQGPIQKAKSSFILSARRSHINLLLKAFGTPQKNTSYKFYDVNAKMNFEPGKNDHIFLSYFKGADDAGYNNVNSLNYATNFGNSTATLRWNHLFGGKTFSNTSLIYNDYALGLSTSQNNFYSLLYTSVKDFTAKTDFTITPDTKHKIKTGFSFIHHALAPASFSAAVPRRGNKLTINKDSVHRLYSSEIALYAADAFEVSPQFSIAYGIRVPLFSARGKTYTSLEPRATVKYSLSPLSSIKASYTRMNQFLHLIPNSTAGLPTDIWLPSSNRTKPQSSTQYAIGYFQNFKDNAIEASAELYYKTMNNQVLFGEGKQLKVNADLDSLIVSGKGKSYGMELFVKKNSGRLTGWASYTLSKTTQQFDALNFGKSFPFRYDRRHNLALTASYAVTKTWTFSAVFVYASGASFTVPSGRISTLNSGTIFEGNYYVYEGRNNYRMAPYHRLDLAAANKKTVKIFKKRYEREWVFGVYNAYSRLNPYFVYFEVDALTSKPTARQVSLLPIIPSVSFNFKF